MPRIGFSWQRTTKLILKMSAMAFPWFRSNNCNSPPLSKKQMNSYLCYSPRRKRSTLLTTTFELFAISSQAISSAQDQTICTYQVTQVDYKELKTLQLSQSFLFPSLSRLRQKQKILSQIQLPRLYELARNTLPTLLRKEQTHKGIRHVKCIARRSIDQAAILQSLLEESHRTVIVYLEKDIEYS